LAPGASFAFDVDPAQKEVGGLAAFVAFELDQFRCASAEGDEAVLFRVRGRIVGDGDVHFATLNAEWTSFASWRGDVGIHQREGTATGGKGHAAHCLPGSHRCHVGHSIRGLQKVNALKYDRCCVPTD
jgi:hypothetical protein